MAQAPGEPSRGPSPEPADATLPSVSGDTLVPGGAASQSGPGPVAQPPTRYEVVEELGRGGIGAVFLAEDRRLGRAVALKELQVAHGADARRFVREAQLTAGLEHPGIVPVYDLDQRPDGAPFYTMRRIRGRSLRSVVAATPALEGRLRLVRHFREACEAVAYAHAHGVVHRDLKPDNIMVGEFGETVVLDWGLAKRRGQGDEAEQDLQRRTRAAYGGAGQTMQGKALGTPAYMSPEQARGDVAAIDERSDVWGLGAILFEILTRRPPFVGADPLSVVEKVAHEEPASARLLCPDAPPELVAVVERALRRDPAARYATARELADEIGAWLDGRPVRSYHYSALQLARLFVRRNRAASVAALVVLLAVLAATAVSLDRWRQEVRARRAEQERRVEAEQARSRAEDRDREARRMLARALQEKALRALADRDHAAAAVYAAAALRDMAAEPGDDAAERRAVLRSAWMEAQEGRRATWLRSVDLGAAQDRADRDVTALAFSPDGARLAVVDRGSRVLVFDDPASGLPPRVASGVVCPRTVGRDMHLSWSPDGGRLAVSSRGTLECRRNLAVLDVATLERVPAPEVAEAASAAYSPDGKTLAVGTADGRLVLWPLAGGTPVTVKASEAVRELAWSEKGLVAAGQGDGGLFVARADGKVVSRAKITFYPSDLLFLSGGASWLAMGTDAIWWRFRTADGALEQRVDLPEWEVTVGASADQRLVVSGGITGRSVLRDSADARQLDVVHFGDGGPSQVDLSADGRLLALAGYPSVSAAGERLAVRLYRVAPAQAQGPVADHGSSVYDVAATEEGVYTASFDGTVRRWPAEPAPAAAGLPAGELVADLRDEGALLLGLALSPDRRLLAVMTSRGGVEVWDVAGRRRLRTLRGQADFQYVGAGVAFSPDGATVAAAVGREVVEWSTRDFAETGRLAGHEGDVWGLAFSRDGRFVATSDAAGTVRLWPAAGGEPRVIQLMRPKEIVSGVEFSPDSRELLATGNDALAHLLDVETGRERLALKGHRIWVNNGAFSPDGRYVLTGGDDQTARLWDRETGAQLRILRSREQVITAAFSPDGRWMFFNDRNLLRRVPAVPGPSDPPEVLLDKAERAAGMRLEGLDLVPITP